MNVLLLISCAAAVLFAGYHFYGNFLRKLFVLRFSAKTPAHTLRDGTDFVPTNRWYLLGQHLSAIAAAGPIVGPILAGMWFGWLPVMFWILVGGIFIGGVHDLASLVASIRHQGKSIAEVIRENMSQRAFVIFLLFLWFTIIYIITAFTDITASTFVEPQRGAGIASSSMLYLLLALVMGSAMRLLRLPLLVSTLIFFPLVFVCIWLGPLLPVSLPAVAGLTQTATWDIFLLFYCFIAAVTPVWLLLQPRGYLGGFFLAVTALIAFIGLVVASLTRNMVVVFPAFLGWSSPAGLPLLPLLFTTVACGACSGFHAIVSSGTSSKQLDRETDARLVGYGAMILESFVALIALSTLLVISRQQADTLSDPNQVYASGIATFLSALGINRELALNFALLAFATFVYDTLDVATRLGRYIFEELTGMRSKASAFIATAATLLLPAVFVTQRIVDDKGNPIPAWKIFWTVFGSSNQLLAAMVLFGLSVWLSRKKSNPMVTLLPALFMIVVAVVSIFFVLRGWLSAMFLSGAVIFDPLAITGSILLVLAVLLLIEGTRILAEGK